jgi:V/A-type H+-transporting ATPase subunit I
MIVRMSKVEIAGPRDLMEEVLSFLRDTGTLEIEPSTIGVLQKIDEVYIDSYLPDKNSLSEKIFLEDLKSRINELLSYLPQIDGKRRYFQPQTIIDTINETLQRHLMPCRESYKKKEELQKEMAELSHYSTFLDAIEPLIEDMKAGASLDFIGLTLKNEDAEIVLRKALTHLADDRFELLTSEASDGTTVGLIAVNSHMADRIKDALSDRNIPELKFPLSFGDLPFIDKINFLKQRIPEIQNELDIINIQLDSFSVKWGPIYKSIRDWIDERLLLFKATASVFVSRMCFFIYGWMATENISSLTEHLNSNYKGKVVLEELEIQENDIERVPVILKNPAYFKPFELFTRILPLPRYTSYDPTPFIGIFFPLFFGMILGDAGYGILIIIVSLALMAKFKKNKIVSDATKILVIAAFYTILFGILYGEFFGELGHEHFGMKPVFIDRRTAVIPMLYFAISVGVVHILLGTLLGFINALRKKTKKEAIFKLIHLLSILCILSLVATLFGLFPALLTRPIILTILVLSLKKHRKYHLLCQDNGDRAHICASCIRCEPPCRNDRRHHTRSCCGRTSASFKYNYRNFFSNHTLSETSLCGVFQ